MDALLAESLAKAKISVEQIDQEFARLCFADVRKLYRPGGGLLPMAEWPDDIAAAVAGLETIERVTTGKRGARSRNPATWVRKVRLWDKVSALTLAARRLGLLKDRVTLGGTLSLEELVLESFKPKEKPNAD